MLVESLHDKRRDLVLGDVIVPAKDGVVLVSEAQKHLRVRLDVILDVVFLSCGGVRVCRHGRIGGIRLALRPIFRKANLEINLPPPRLADPAQALRMGRVVMSWCGRCRRHHETNCANGKMCFHAAPCFSRICSAVSCNRISAYRSRSVIRASIWSFVR